MEVWVVTGGYDYEDTYVLGVAKNKNKADKIAKKEKGSLDWVSVDEWEMEE